MTHIGIDLGTSNIKAVLMDDGDAVLAMATVPVTVSIPQIGWAEQDADGWVAATLTCLDRIAADAPAAMTALRGIGLSGQMLTALVLGAEHRPLRPAILWNDRRAIAECADLLARVPDIGQRTNCAPDPGITAPKLLWLARHEPRVMEQARMLVMAKDYLRLALTGDLGSEPTDAGGTQLMDVAKGQWDSALCKAAGWNPAYLPPLSQPWAAAGDLRAALRARWGIAGPVAVAAGTGDNMGSTLGGGATRPGDTVISIGTSAVTCIVDAGFHPGPGRAILTAAHAVPAMFLSMGVVMSATASLDWMAGIAGLPAAALVEAATAFAARGRINEAPVALPTLSGIRTPLNRPDAMGRIDGLHPGTTPAMLGYAVMEGVAFQIAACLQAQRGIGVHPGRFVLAGGGARSELWLRLVASVLGQPVDLAADPQNAGPAGAVRLARVAAGAAMDTLQAPAPIAQTFAPDPVLRGVLADRQARFSAMLPLPG
jgi:xylulokinase